MKLLNALILFIIIIAIPLVALFGSWLNDKGELPIVNLRDLVNDHFTLIVIVLVFAAAIAYYLARKMDEEN